MTKTIILNKHSGKLIFSICSNGNFEDKIFDLDNNLDLMGNIIKILFDDNLSATETETNHLSFQNAQIFIIDKPNISLKYRKDMAEIMFGLLNISAFYITTQSALALYDNDIVTGTVIDYYDNKLYSVPIYDECIMKNAVGKINMNKKEICKCKEIINANIKSSVRKCRVNQQMEIKENIIYSTNVPKQIIEHVDDFEGEIILGDPLNGAKKVIQILNSKKCWITKEKYKEIGGYIVGKKCFN